MSSRPFISTCITGDFDNLDLLFPEASGGELFGAGTLNQFHTTSESVAMSHNWIWTCLCGIRATGSVDLAFYPETAYGGPSLTNLNASWSLNTSWTPSVFEISGTAPDFTDGALPLAMYPDPISVTFNLGNRTFNPGLAGSLVCNFTATVTFDVLPPSYRKFAKNPSIVHGPPVAGVYPAPSGPLVGTYFFAESYVNATLVVNTPTIVSNDTGFLDHPTGTSSGITLGPGGTVGIDADETGWNYGLSHPNSWRSIWATDQLSTDLTVTYSGPGVSPPSAIAWHDFILHRDLVADPSVGAPWISGPPVANGFLISTFAFGPRRRYGPRDFIIA